MRVQHVLWPLALLLGACAVDQEEGGGGEGERALPPVRTSRSAIVNGNLSTAAHDAAVLLTIGTGAQAGSCTGTFIAPNLILTARHCVQGTTETSECGAFTTRIVPSTIAVSIGVRANAAQAVARGKQTFVDEGTSMCSHDIGLILLDTEVKGAKIAKVRFTKIAAGEITTTVGYGDDGLGALTAGRFERTALKVDAVGPSAHTYTTLEGQKIPFTVHPGEIATGESTCFGDSGGPLFDEEARVIGLTSRGLDQECVDRPSIFTDTASHQKLITDAAKTAGHPLALDGDETTPADDGPATGNLEDPLVGSKPKKTGPSPTKSGNIVAPQPNAGCAIASAGAFGARSTSCPIAAAAVAIALLAMRRRRIIARDHGLRREQGHQDRGLRDERGRVRATHARPRGQATR